MTSQYYSPVVFDDPLIMIPELIQGNGTVPMILGCPIGKITEDHIYGFGRDMLHHIQTVTFDDFIAECLYRFFRRERGSSLSKWNIFNEGKTFCGSIYHGYRSRFILFFFQIS